MKISTVSLAMLAAVSATPALAVDWASVPGKEVVLFYPGQSSREWTMTEGEHDGAAKYKGGKNCSDCHIGEEKKKGDRVVAGKTNEPTPIAGKPGWVAATVKTAHDDKNFYVHLDFNEGTQPDSKMDAAFATKVTMMVSDGAAAESVRNGCWSTCHDDNSKMASAGAAERTKYLGKTRAKQTRQGGGDELKPAEELAKMKAAGEYLEFWQAKLNPGAKAVADSFIVFDKRDEVKPNAVTAEGTLANGAGSVTLSRPLSAGAPYKDLVAGKTYTVGFAIHGGHTAKRFHYVSFAHTLVLDSGAADLVAVKK